MKLHLPNSLFRALIACFALSVALAGASFAESADSVTYTTHQKGPLNISGQSDVIFENIQSGGAISNGGTCTLSDNGNVTFSGNKSGYVGGAIDNRGTCTLSDNGNVTFSGNKSGYVGGAIYNRGTFTLSGNGKVLFEKNAEVDYESGYRLRSIYSAGTLNLSASEGKTITFRDSVYASGMVNLNHEGSGDIIFTGATTEADLREVKGGVAGTDSEIQSSRHSAMNANVTLFGGSLQLQDGVSLVAEALNIGTGMQSARLELRDASLVSTTLTLESGSDMQLNGRNYLLTGAFEASGDNVLSITIGAEHAQGTALTLMGNLKNADNLHIRINDVSGLDGTNYRILHMVGSTSGWEQVQLDAAGAKTDAFTWINGDLYLNYDAATLVEPERRDLTIQGRDEDIFLFLEGYGALRYEGYNAGITKNKDCYGFIIDNTSVTFRENKFSSSRNSNAYGGAINNSGTFTLSGNGNVTFSGNTVYSYRSFLDPFPCGGAINNSGTFSLCGNKDVIFEKNAEIKDDPNSYYSYSYRLRSIYSTGTLNLSASEGKTITFRDSVYASGVVNLNQDGSGNIIFTGATTEADLREVKGGEAGTDSEIQSSRHSVMNANVTLFGGSLQLQDGVSLVADALNIGTGAQSARLELRDASLISTKLTLESGSEMQLNGRNYLLTGEIEAYGDNVLALTIGAELAQGTALTLMGNLKNADNLHIRINDVSGLEGTNYRVLHTVGSSSCWQQVQMDLAEGGTDAFTWVNGDLYLNYDAATFVVPERRDLTIQGRDEDIFLFLEGYGALRYEGFNAGITKNKDCYGFIIDNTSVTFGGCQFTPIENFGTFLLSWNGAVSFIENAPYIKGGAIGNFGTFSLAGNENVIFSGNSAAYDYDTWGGAIYNSGDFILSGNGDVSFSGNMAYCIDVWWNPISINAQGGAIYTNGEFTMSGNGNVSFSGNSASGFFTDFIEYYLTCPPSYIVQGGAIYNNGTFALEGNGDVSFSGNSVSSSTYLGGVECSTANNAHGGAICNNGTFSLSGNADVSFSGNSASNTSLDFDSGYDGYYYYSPPSYNVQGGAIYNNGSFTLSDNGKVSFSGNSVSGSTYINYVDYVPFNDVQGGAIYNSGTFILSGNEDVTFCGNSVSSSSFVNGLDYCLSNNAQGGAIYNSGSFTVRDNGNVLFNKNTEICNGVYRLRSIYSDSWNALNLSSPEGKSITFRDSVYAGRGSVNLNLKGAGDIIFTGISTESDLREVKGGVDGTSEEILNSRTSEIATNAMLYGGRLIVEDGAILKGHGITVTEGANATIRLKDATLDETGYTIAVSAGSGLELEGDNVLNAASVQMADGAFLSFVMGEGSDTNWDAQLITGQLNVQVSGDLFSEHRLLTLSDASQYDTSRWTSDTVTVSGAGFDSLSWADGVLTYTPHVMTPDADGSIDETLPDDGNAIINGNGHTLNVKNEVQLVQMALKDGIVKLEGENNGIVSVTLTEGGELVLTAGAGLKTGDIISMVASGKGELVISGDITLDNKGMKGKTGALATVSHADAQVLGDATISNVHVEDSVIDLAEGITVGFEHVVLAATTRITDDPATANLDDVTAELVLGVNTSLTGSDMLMAGTALAQSGNTGVTLTLSADASVLMLEATTFDSLTLSGSTLVLELAGMTLEMFDNAELIAVSFTSGTGYASFDKSLAVTLSVDGINYERGYTMEAEDTPTTMYFRGGKKPAATPEPASTTLSLLALAALATRRKRK